MKLQRRFAYKYKDKSHFKHLVVIPGDTIEKLGWKPGYFLEQRIENGALIIKPAGDTARVLRSKERGEQ